MKKRTINAIAIDIYSDWSNIYFGAKPYLEAMMALNDINDSFYFDSAKSIIRYFLANAGSWRGEKAREIKKELKELLKN